MEKTKTQWIIDKQQSIIDSFKRVLDLRDYN